MATRNAVGNSLTGSTGSGAFVGATAPIINTPTLVTPALGTPGSGNLSNCTGYPGVIVPATASGTTQSAAVNTLYVCTNASQCNVTLPATCAVGDQVGIAGQGAGGWKATANTGQTINVGNTATSTAGNITSAHRYDNVSLICVVANTTWNVFGNVSSGYTVS